MKKVVTYEYGKMVRAGQILNDLHIFGVNQARLVAELGNILDSGTPGEVMEKEDDKNAMGQKEV